VTIFQNGDHYEARVKLYLSYEAWLERDQEIVGRRFKAGTELFV